MIVVKGTVYVVHLLIYSKPQHLLVPVPLRVATLCQQQHWPTEQHNIGLEDTSPWHRWDAVPNTFVEIWRLPHSTRRTNDVELLETNTNEHGPLTMQCLSTIYEHDPHPRAAPASQKDTIPPLHPTDRCRVPSCNTSLPGPQHQIVPSHHR